MERRNQEIKKGLRLRLCREALQECDRHLPEIVFNTRRRRNAATRQTPAELLLGRNLAHTGERPATNPADLHHRIEAARTNQEAYLPTEPEEGPNPPLVGDMVYTRNHPLSDAVDKWNAGLAPRWVGPFEVVEHLGPETFNIRRPRGKLVKYHISQLKCATTAIYQQAKDDEIPAANDPPDDPDPPQRKRGHARKSISMP
jgi:hypothetical protein